MKYLLDSNVCVDYLTGRNPEVTTRIQSLLPEDLCLSSIVVAELRYGADKSARPRRNHRLLDVLTNEIRCRGSDSKAASIYGKVRVALERPGSTHRPKRHAHRRSRALSLGLALVSDNVRDSREFGDSG